MIPFHLNSSFFLICVNLLKSNIEIIDSSDACDDLVSPKALYGNIPTTLRTYFSKFLLARGMKSQASSVSKFGIKVLRIPWRDRANVVDAGVFLMRHMESYMGGGIDRWASGLRKGWKKQLNYLRARYTHALLLSDVNEVDIDIKREAAAHFKIHTKSQKLTSMVLSRAQIIPLDYSFFYYKL